MNENDAISNLNRLVDGQEITVSLASGRVIKGIYDGERSSLEDGLYFETFEGNLLRAEWDKVEDVGFRSARAVAGSVVVPPSHPLASPDDRMKPYTSRNR